MAEVRKKYLLIQFMLRRSLQKIVLDTLSKLGVFNIELDYVFNAENGTAYRKNIHEL